MIERELATGITQQRLAEKMGVSQATIHKLLYTETAHTVAVLKKVADYFKKDINDLMGAGAPTLTDEEERFIRAYRIMKVSDSVNWGSNPYPPATFRA